MFDALNENNEIQPEQRITEKCCAQFVVIFSLVVSCFILQVCPEASLFFFVGSSAFSRLFSAQYVNYRLAFLTPHLIKRRSVPPLSQPDRRASPKLH